MTGFAEDRHFLVVVDNATVGVHAAIAGVFDSLVPVDRGAKVQSGLSGGLSAGDPGLTEPEVLRASGPAVFLSINAAIDQPFVVIGGMKIDLAGREADLAEAFERVEELGLRSLPVDPARSPS